MGADDTQPPATALLLDTECRSFYLSNSLYFSRAPLCWLRPLQKLRLLSVLDHNLPLRPHFDPTQS